MILGGGKTGLYLAMLLLKENIDVTIVEDVEVEQISGMLVSNCNL